MRLQKGPIASLLAGAVLCLGLAGLPLRAAADVPTGRSADHVRLSQIRFGGDATTTRVVLDLDGPVQPRLIAAESLEGRLVFSLPGALAAPLPDSAEGGPGHGLVKSWRVSNEGQGGRLVLELAAGAASRRRFLIPPSPESPRWRYVIDIVDQDPVAALISGGAEPPPATPSARAAIPRALPDIAAFSGEPSGAGPALPSAASPPQRFAQAAWAPAERIALADSLAVHDPSAYRAAAGRAIAARTPWHGRQKVIVVDAGHGGHDPGARSLVRNEKDITLAAALDLKSRLEAMGPYRVVLTRGSDVFVPLEARVQIARRAGADLFISLHADSAGTDPTPHGASVYTLSDHGETRVNTVLGPREWFSSAGGAHPAPGVRQILLDLTQRSTLNRSAQFASTLIDHIGDKVDLLPRSHRDAGYFVLLAPDVPAVLLEMGFITNPADELRLTDPAQRDQLMGGVAEAIDAYFSGARTLAAG